MHIQFQLAQQCIQISTRINSSSVHTYIFVCFTLRVILQGFVTQNATWCQNRGCICISSVRRTYGRIHIPASTIILWTELFPKKKREKIQGDQSIFKYRIQWCFHIQSFYLQELQNFFEYSVSTHNPTFLQELQCFHTQSSNSK